MKLPKFISNNLVLKITSVNAVVIAIRLIVSVFIQRILALTVGEAGIANIGQVRNLIAMLSSTTTLGAFSGVVKYVAEFKENRPEISRLFSTATLFLLIGSLLSAAILFFTAEFLSSYIFNSSDYVYVFHLLAVVVPFIGLGRLINGVVSGLSDYKKYAKIELIGYLLVTGLLVFGLYTNELKGVILAIALAPIIQLLVLIFVFGKTLKTYVKLNSIKLNLSYKNQLLAFTLMSFVSAFLINFVELDIRTVITDEININEAGYWTAITFISKNYMVFATGMFTLYVLPKFSSIKTKEEFKQEVLHIYKSILPVFGLGMLLVFLLRNLIIEIVYPEFKGMEPLFKWQLLGDFIRLAALVLSYQFLAKRMVKSFVITELISLALFYIFTTVFIKMYGTEGVVIAHFVRYILYFIVVVFFVQYNFKSLKS
ncbi:O-antigen translocase [Winogradskyella sp. PG-2]|uniref:O-antigen translocase n=1 Tax=Winogradskyella sp. PG-2 TaxID=754409 RepID=UPI00045877FE|nr:O-antigen translocase [Winogradskyella sp. PG-2]BAO76634.1 lipopolysaccharide biosynthesis protein [Winogradskyella sp. PG-2]